MQWTKMTASQRAAAEALRDELFAAGVETSKSALAKEFDVSMAYKRGEVDLATLCEAIGADLPATPAADEGDEPATEEPVEIEPPAAEYMPTPGEGQTAWISLYDQAAPDVDGVELGEVAHVLPMAEVLDWAEERGYGELAPDLYVLVSVDPDASIGPAVDTLEVQVSRIAAAEIRGAAVWGDEPLGREDVARLLGVAPDTVSHYMLRYRDTENPFPTPDGVLGRSPWWSAARAGEILVWDVRRPGRTGRPRKTTA